MDFNPHSHAGSDEHSRSENALAKNFNPHSHAGSDKTIQNQIVSYWWFQSTLPRREWPNCTSNITRQNDFNPHSHAGSDCCFLFSKYFLFISIHTPTQGVTEIAYAKNEFNEISIHTPTQGVTYKWEGLPDTIDISIHTPTQGVTTQWFSELITRIFQSTLPRREWRICFQNLYRICFISIHTPTQGVTTPMGSLEDPFSISIHTPTQGVTGAEIQRSQSYIHFNPHSHAGSDGLNCPKWTHKLYFNPHSHAGSDFIRDDVCFCSLISIHTPTQGVTAITNLNSDICDISIHTPTQGVTKNESPSVRYRRFQSTLPRREWQNPYAFMRCNLTDFNPHSHAGSDKRFVII